jgi:hypothetical protein
MNVHTTPLHLDQKKQKMTTKNFPNPILKYDHKAVNINFNVMQKLSKQVLD